MLWYWKKDASKKHISILHSYACFIVYQSFLYYFAMFSLKYVFIPCLIKLVHMLSLAAWVGQSSPPTHSSGECQELVGLPEHEVLPDSLALLFIWWAHMSKYHTTWAWVFCACRYVLWLIPSFILAQIWFSIRIGSHILLVVRRVCFMRHVWVLDEDVSYISMGICSKWVDCYPYDRGCISVEFLVINEDISILVWRGGASGPSCS